MQFKHFLYWGAVCCAVGQLLMALYARFYGDIASQIQAAEVAAFEGELAIVKALNYALPIGVGCMGFLLYTWKINHVGGFALVCALGLQAAALDLNLRAVRYVFGKDVKMESVAWWYPDKETVHRLTGG
jgi:hypothetical protein